MPGLIVTRFRRHESWRYNAALTPVSLWPLGVLTRRTELGTPLLVICRMSPRIVNSSCDQPVRTCAPAFRLCAPVRNDTLPAHVFMRAVLVSIRGDTPLMTD